MSRRENLAAIPELLTQTKPITESARADQSPGGEEAEDGELEAEAERGAEVKEETREAW